MRKLLLFIICIGLAAGLNAQSGKKVRKTASNSKEAVTERQISSRFNQGLRSYYTTQYEEALRQFYGILSDAPKHAPSYFMIGRIYTDQQQYTDAENTLAQAVKLDKNNIWYQVELAKANMTTSNYKSATPLWEKICREMPDNPEYLAALADCYDRTGKSDKAAELHTRINALKQNTQQANPKPDANTPSNDAEGSLAKGLALLAAKDYAHATDMLEQALREDDTNYDLWAAFAEATDKSQQWQKFTSREEDVTTLFPQSSALLYALAQAFLKSGQPEKAVEYFQQARAFAFEQELVQQIRKGLFEAYTALGDTDNANRFR